jgi:hypothetical protein
MDQRKIVNFQNIIYSADHLTNIILQSYFAILCLQRVFAVAIFLLAWDQVADRAC